MAQIFLLNKSLRICMCMLRSYECNSRCVQLAVINPRAVQPKWTRFSLSPSAERGHSVHPLPVLPGRDGLGPWEPDGRHQGTSSQAGRGCRWTDLPTQAVSQAYECHGEVAQGHPGARGHGEVLRQGETAKL